MKSSKEANHGPKPDVPQRIEKRLEVPLAVLALVWGALFVVELAFTLPPDISQVLLTIDFAIWLIFAVVFVLELLLAPDKLAFLRSNIFAALSVAVPFLRATRFLRLVRFVPLLQVLLAIARGARAAGRIFAEHRFQYVLSLLAIAVLLGSSGIYFFERDVNSPYADFWEAMWYALTTVTTITNLPDPSTIEARVIAMILRLIALGVLGYITASIASFLVEERVAGRIEPASRERESIEHLTVEVENLRKAVEALSDGKTVEEADKAN